MVGGKYLQVAFRCDGLEDWMARRRPALAGSSTSNWKRCEAGTVACYIYAPTSRQWDACMAPSRYLLPSGSRATAIHHSTFCFIKIGFSNSRRAFTSLYSMKGCMSNSRSVCWCCSTSSEAVNDAAMTRNEILPPATVLRLGCPSMP